MVLAVTPVVSPVLGPDGAATVVVEPDPLEVVEDAADLELLPQPAAATATTAAPAIQTARRRWTNNFVLPLTVGAAHAARVARL